MCRTRLLLLMGLTLAGGCMAPLRSAAPQVSTDTLDDTAFVHYLAVTPAVTVDEGFRAMLLTQDGPQPADFEARQELLIRQNVIRTAWQLDRDRLFDKGTLAFMVLTICPLPRSFNDLLSVPTGFGDRRNALRTCIAAGVMPYGLPYEPVTGGELLSVLTKVERWREMHPADGK